MNYNNIHIELDLPIAVLTICREKALNSLDNETIEEIYNALSLLEKDKKIKVVIITAKGKAFIAGADIKHMSSFSSKDVLKFSQKGHRLMKKIQYFKKPVICAVNGYALGGGLELVLCCDIVIASPKARFGLPEINLGLIPGFGGTQRLIRLVGKNLAKEIIFTGDSIDAKRAYEIGIVNKIVPQNRLLAESKALAKRIGSKSSTVLRIVKELLEKTQYLELQKGLKTEIALFVKCFRAKDAKEGLKAFLEKRVPRFD